MNTRHAKLLDVSFLAEERQDISVYISNELVVGPSIKRLIYLPIADRYMGEKDEFE